MTNDSETPTVAEAFGRNDLLPEILAARDQRVAEAIAMWFDQHPLTAWIATHIRSGQWRKK